MKERLRGCVLPWGDESAARQHLSSSSQAPLTVVLCSDLLYGDGPPAQEARHEAEVEIRPACALAKTLDLLCSSRDTLVLSCHEQRYAGDGGAYFFEMLQNMGFLTERVDLGHVDEDYADEDGIVLNRIRRP